MSFSTDTANRSRNVQQCRKFPLFPTHLNEQTRITRSMAETMISTTIETGLSTTFTLTRRPAAKGNYLKPQGARAGQMFLVACFFVKQPKVARQESNAIFVSEMALTAFVNLPPTCTFVSFSTRKSRKGRTRTSTARLTTSPLPYPSLLSGHRAYRGKHRQRQ